MTANSSANSVILKVFGFSDNLSAENYLRILESREFLFFDVCTKIIIMVASHLYHKLDSNPHPVGIILMRGVASVGDMFLVTAGTEICHKEKAKYCRYHPNITMITFIHFVFHWYCVRCGTQICPKGKHRCFYPTKMTMMTFICQIRKKAKCCRSSRYNGDDNYHLIKNGWGRIIILLWWKSLM